MTRLPRSSPIGLAAALALLAAAPLLGAAPAASAALPIGLPGAAPGAVPVALPPTLSVTLKAPAAVVTPVATKAASTLARTLRTSAPLALPALPGAVRAARNIDVTILSPTGDTVALTVFEPAGFVEGQTYPLVLHGHGFGLSRLNSQGLNPATPGTSDLNVAQGVADLVANGYGVISFDQRGHGQSSGAVRVMDPDVEGQNLIAILDWAEANLPWLMYRPSADGRDPRNLVVGAVGGSYGGMHQLLLAHIDPKQRLDAIVPEIAPHSLNYSLAPQNVPKTLWSTALFGLGTTAGRMTGSTFDPFVLAGIPMVDLTLTPNGPAVPPTVPAISVPGVVNTPEANLSANRPILFVGVGVVRTDGQVELVDNQITPLRGLGRHLLPLAGVGQRLSNGERLALLVYGAHEQYLLNGSVALQPTATTVQPLTVSGVVAMPLHEANLPTP